MKNDRNSILLKSVKRLLRRDAIVHLCKIVNKTHGADLSELFRSLSIPQQHIVFNLIEDIEQKGILLSQLDENDFLALSEDLEIDSFVEVLECMPSDDAADLIGRLPDEQAETLLEKMKNEESKEVEELLNYEDDTAGGIMVTDFIALKEDTTAKEAIRSLQKEHMDVEMPFYLYAVDEYGNLMGVCSLRQLVVVPPETPL
ncbi:MAG: magnesium transporter, partial [Deltaproteobacteria bacterium]|nr:magnesium transporter [Deltaproteobacteria bacterium]